MRRKNRPAQPGKLASSAADRIGTIIEAAERAAETVIDDAEAQAGRYLAEAQAEADRIVSERLSSLSELTDSIAAQAEEIRRQSERLLESLEAAKVELQVAGPEDALALADSEPVEEGSRGSHLAAVAPVSEPEVERGEPVSQPADQATPAGARLLATQMAVSGNSREEIDSRLRNGFEIEDTTAILDAILGPEE